MDSLVKNLSKYGLKYLSQESDNNVLDLVKQKEFYPFEYITDFEKFKEELPRKKKNLYLFNWFRNYWQRIWTCSEFLE